VLQGYNAQAAATVDQIVIAAEVTATTNDQPQFVPMATAVTENLAAAGHDGGIAAFVADAGYWTAANGATDVGAQVLIATKKSSWRKADKPDDDKLAVLAKVNRGELSQRQAGEILSVSYTWIRDMTKRYFGREGQRLTRTAAPEPDEWIPVIERLARGEISKRAARDELTASDRRVNTMLAHVRGEAVDPSIARRAMDAKLAEPNQRRPLPQTAAQHRTSLRQHQGKPRLPAIHPSQLPRREQRMAPDLRRPQHPQAPTGTARLNPGSQTPKTEHYARTPADSCDSLFCVGATSADELQNAVPVRCRAREGRGALVLDSPAAGRPPAGRTGRAEGRVRPPTAPGRAGDCLGLDAGSSEDFQRQMILNTRPATPLRRPGRRLIRGLCVELGPHFWPPQ